MLAEGNKETELGAASPDPFCRARCARYAWH
jgi:hypothetical protein